MIIAELCERAGMPPGVFNVSVHARLARFTQADLAQRPRIGRHCQ